MKSSIPQKQWCVVLVSFPIALMIYPDKSNLRENGLVFRSQFQGAVYHGGEIKEARAWSNWFLASRFKKKRKMHVNAQCPLHLKQPRTLGPPPSQKMLPWNVTTVYDSSHFNYPNQDNPPEIYPGNSGSHPGNYGGSITARNFCFLEANLWPTQAGQVLYLWATSHPWW